MYGTALTVALIANKLKEHNLGYVKLNVTTAGSHIQLGCFDVELIHVNHSISDAVGLALHTPAGVIVHTGDFKIDFTPTQGGMIDLARFAQLGQEGVLLLMADSTNAERPGYTQTEQKVNATFDALFARAEANKKRLIIATFASLIGSVSPDFRKSLYMPILDAYAHMRRCAEAIENAPAFTEKTARAHAVCTRKTRQIEAECTNRRAEILQKLKADTEAAITRTNAVLLYHLLINNRFQFRSDDFPTARTAFIVQPFRAAEILFAGGIVDTHKSIPAIPALDFSCQPCVGGFPGRLDFHVVHQLLAAGQPGVGGDDTLMGSFRQCPARKMGV